MTAPQVSVVMPVFNAGPDLDQSVKSILNQGFPELEFWPSPINCASFR